MKKLLATVNDNFDTELALALAIPIMIRGAGAFSVDGALAARINT